MKKTKSEQGSDSTSQRCKVKIEPFWIRIRISLTLYKEIILGMLGFAD